MPRSGFSLVEVLVSVTVLSVAVLAYVGAAGALSRTLSRGVVRRQVGELVQGALERARLSGCVGGGSGTTAKGPVTVHWQASPGSVALDIVVVAQWSRGTAVRADTFVTAAPCL